MEWDEISILPIQILEECPEFTGLARVGKFLNRPNISHEARTKDEYTSNEVSTRVP